MVSVTHLLLRPGRRMSIMIGAIALLAVGITQLASSQDQMGGASNWSNWRCNARSARTMGRVNMSKPVG